MIRVTKVAKDNAVKARSSAMISLKQVVVNAPDDLRQSLQDLPRMTLIRRCAGLRPGPLAMSLPLPRTHCGQSRAAGSALTRRSENTITAWPP